MTTKELDERYVAHSYGRFDAVLTKGSGSVIYDENGKKYIDFGSGIGVTAFGIADTAWQQAVTEQLAKLQHVSNLYYTAPCTELASLLCNKTGMEKVFFCNSGAEANECAIKFARKYSFDKYGEGRSTIITLKDSFHGRTVTTLSATGQDEFHTLFHPFTPGFVYCPANDSTALSALATADVCAIMLECIQGEGGVIDITQEFADAVSAIAKKKDILVVVDEVQTGNGRTGTYFAYEQLGLEPDIVTTAKGLGGGLPIGATLFGKKTADTVTAGSHGSTFGGNPIAAAGAVSIVKRIDGAMLKEVTEKGAYIQRFVSGIRGVKSISGKGLMLGIESDKNANEISRQCLAAGLLVLTAHYNKIRLLPALNISYKELDEGLNILKAVIEA